MKKDMKNILRTLIVVCVVNVAFAQQVPLTSQYMFNNYLLNPAEAGTKAEEETAAHSENDEKFHRDRREYQQERQYHCEVERQQGLRRPGLVKNWRF